jgi:Skp family chaperone for outer membrane proteins
MGQSMAMSPDRLNKKQAKLKELRKSFTRKQQDAQEELLSKKNALDEGILMNFYDVVRTYGKDNHYDLLLQKSAMFYADPKYDITPKITKILDQKKKK